MADRPQPRQTFYASHAVLGFAIGIAAPVPGPRAPTKTASDGNERPRWYMAGIADHVCASGPRDLPLVHHIVDEFAIHDGHDSYALD